MLTEPVKLPLPRRRWKTWGGVPRHRRTAGHRCRAGSILAPDGWPRPGPRRDRAPGHLGTGADDDM